MWSVKVLIFIATLPSRHFTHFIFTPCSINFLPVLYGFCLTPNDFSHPSSPCCQHCSHPGPLCAASPGARQACPVSSGAPALPLVLAYTSSATSAKVVSLRTPVPFHASTPQNLSFIYLGVYLCTISFPHWMSVVWDVRPCVFYFPPCPQGLSQWYWRNAGWFCWMTKELSRRLGMCSVMGIMRCV